MHVIDRCIATSIILRYRNIVIQGCNCVTDVANFVNKMIYTVNTTHGDVTMLALWSINEGRIACPAHSISNVVAKS